MQEFDSVRHHTNIKVVTNWVFGACLWLLMVVVTVLAASHVLSLVSRQLAGVDWGAMFNLGIFLVMVGIAVALPIKARRRSSAG